MGGGSKGFHGKGEGKAIVGWLDGWLDMIVIENFFKEDFGGRLEQAISFMNDKYALCAG